MLQVRVVRVAELGLSDLQLPMISKMVEQKGILKGLTSPCGVSYRLWVWESASQESGPTFSLLRLCGPPYPSPPPSSLEPQPGHHKFCFVTCTDSAH